MYIQYIPVPVVVFYIGGSAHIIIVGDVQRIWELATGKVFPGLCHCGTAEYPPAVWECVWSAGPSQQKQLQVMSLEECCECFVSVILCCTSCISPKKNQGRPYSRTIMSSTTRSSDGGWHAPWTWQQVPLCWSCHTIESLATWLESQMLGTSVTQMQLTRSTRVICRIPTASWCHHVTGDCPSNTSSRTYPNHP